MEVATAIQRGRKTLVQKIAGTTSTNSHHQPTHPDHTLAPLLLCSSNPTNGHLGEGSSGPESSELHQEWGPTVDNTQANPILPNHGAISADDQGMQQDPLLDTPLPTPVPPDVPAAATSEFPSRQVSQTPRWSWMNARDKQRRERSKKRITLTKLCSVRLNLSIVQG
jgi:hypothetical protein